MLKLTKKPGIIVLLAVGLPAMLTGCATTPAPVASNPTCIVPPRPYVADIDKGWVWDHYVDAYKYRGYDDQTAEVLGDLAYRRVDDDTARTAFWALELESGLLTYCED